MAKIWSNIPKKIEGSGRNKIFQSPQELWDSACSYFEWVVKNPIQKEIIYQGEVTGKEKRDRAMTVAGLSLHIGVNSMFLTQKKRYLIKKISEFESPDCVDATRKQEIATAQEYLDVIDAIHSVMNEQKFTGAAAGTFNASLIARDLGLSDNINNEISNKDGEEFKTSSKTTINFIAKGRDD